MERFFVNPKNLADCFRTDEPLDVFFELSQVEHLDEQGNWQFFPAGTLLGLYTQKATADGTPLGMRAAGTPEPAWDGRSTVREENAHEWMAWDADMQDCSEYFERALPLRYQGQLYAIHGGHDAAFLEALGAPYAEGRIHGNGNFTLLSDYQEIDPTWNNRN